MHTFLGTFRSWLDQNGIEHTADWRDPTFNVLFVNSWAVPIQIVRFVKLRRPEVKIVHRIDGSGQDYGRTDDADQRQALVNHWVDLSIFQSRYSRFATTEKFRVISKDGPIIYNPVDLTHFFPEQLASKSGKRLPPGERPRVCNVSFSTNPKKGTWRFAELAQAHPEVDFILCGNYPPMPTLPNIRLMGRLDRVALAETLRNCHLFAHWAENEACPNVVTEALASGLPILYLDSGANRELVGEAGYEVTAESFAAQLRKALSHLDPLSTTARQRAEREFSRQKIFTHYLDAIEAARPAPRPTLGASWRRWRSGYPIWPQSGSALLPWAKRSAIDRLRLWSGRLG